MEELVLVVTRAPRESVVARGQVIVVGRGGVLGRSPEADITVASPRVSRSHLQVDVTPTGLSVVPLTASNGTFLDGEALEPHVPALAPVGALLQVGGVLFTVNTLAATEPVLAPLPPEAEREGTLDLRVVWDAGECTVFCNTHPIPVFGLPARFLGLLADEPGQVVHHHDLVQQLATNDLSNLASRVRTGFREAVALGHLSASALARRLASQAVQVDDEDDPNELCRRLIQVRRNHGYVLHVSPRDVEVVYV